MDLGAQSPSKNQSNINRKLDHIFCQINNRKIMEHWSQNASKIKPESENENFSKLASRPHEVLIFMDLGAHSPSKNQSKINRKIDHIFDQQNNRNIIKHGPRNARKRLPKSDKKRAQANDEKMFEKRGCKLCERCRQNGCGEVGCPLQYCSAEQEYKPSQANSPEQRS